MGSWEDPLCPLLTGERSSERVSLWPFHGRDISQGRIYPEGLPVPCPCGQGGRGSGQCLLSWPASWGPSLCCDHWRGSPGPWGRRQAHSGPARRLGCTGGWSAFCFALSVTQESPRFVRQTGPLGWNGKEGHAGHPPWLRWPPGARDAAGARGPGAPAPTGVGGQLLCSPPGGSQFPGRWGCLERRPGQRGPGCPPLPRPGLGQGHPQARECTQHPPSVWRDLAFKGST